VTQQPREPGTDVIGEFQRWLVRSGARGVSRGVGGQIRSALGRSEGSRDVWERATTLPQDEAPECAWCPVCRAARRLNETGPGLSSQMAAATDAFATVAQDAMSVFEAALAAARPMAKDPAAKSGTAKSGTAKSGTAKSGTGKNGTGKNGTGKGRAGSPASPPPAQAPDEDSPTARRGVWEDAVSAPAEGPPREPDDRR
jgi:hypothetical protein